jgi:predicted SAM-dependent methyltransferase
VSSSFSAKLSLRAFVRDTLFSRAKRLTAKYEIARYLAQTAQPKLNIGAGGNRIPGWLNVDLHPPPGVTCMDASQRWPFEDGSLHAILCEHMIEHVSKPAGEHMLREMRRTLAPGGSARIITPDLNWFAARVLQPASQREHEYLQFVSGFMKRPSTTWCDAINLCFYEHGHRYIWSIEELKAALVRAGFGELHVSRAAHPRQDVFRGVEGHPRLIGLDNDAMEAFAIEVTAPLREAEHGARSRLRMVGGTG